MPITEHKGEQASSMSEPVTRLLLSSTPGFSQVFAGLINTRLQPGVRSKKPREPFLTASRSMKTVETVYLLAGDCTGLKPGVNEKHLTDFPVGVIMRS